MSRSMGSGDPLRNNSQCAFWWLIDSLTSATAQKWILHDQIYPSNQLELDRESYLIETPSHPKLFQPAKKGPCIS